MREYENIYTDVGSNVIDDFKHKKEISKINIDIAKLQEKKQDKIDISTINGRLDNIDNEIVYAQNDIVQIVNEIADYNNVVADVSLRLDNEISLVNEQLNEKASQADLNITNANVAGNANNVINLQSQVNAIVLQGTSGDSSAEVAQARVDIQGITYDTIESRFNALENGIENGTRNLFLKFVQGKIISGVDNDTDTASIKNYGYIKVNIGDVVNFTIASGYQFRINYYDANKNYVAMSNYYTTNQNITMQYPYFRVYICKTDFSAITTTASSNITIAIPLHYAIGDEVVNARISGLGKSYNTLQEHINDLENGNAFNNDSFLPRKMSFIDEVYEMIDQNQITIGSIISNGTINTGITTVYHTGYIKVKPNTKYAYKYFNEIGHIAFYDANKNIISSGGYVSYDGQMATGSTGYLITGANTYYIRATSYGTDYANMSMKLNASKTEMKGVYISSEYILNLQSDSGEIACIGDSLTYGTGSTNNNGYPYVLASLTGKICNKLAFPGDTSIEICGYVSGMPLLVQPVTIPASGSVTIELLDYNENEISIGYQSISAPNINPVTISGVVGNLTLDLVNNDTSLSNDYVFTRSVAGTTVDITYPTPMFTNCGTKNNKDIFIICIGQNGGYDNIDEYISQVDSIINHQDLTNKKFIVVGIPSQNLANLGTLEKALLLKYGRNFINMRDYLVRRGLQDCSITPTSQDNTDISTGKPPTSLRFDTVHFNDQGYNVIATQIYKRGQELGYW